MVFIVEFVLLFWDIRFLYFKDYINIFDFALIIAGTLGLVLTWAVETEDLRGSDASVRSQQVSQQGRLVRGARVFRVLRLIRIFKIFRFMQEFKAKIETKVHHEHVEKHMHKVMLLRAYAQAHTRSQVELVKMFCRDEQIQQIPEIARVIMDSQTLTYLAIALAVQVEQTVDKELLREVATVRECAEIAERL